MDKPAFDPSKPFDVPDKPAFDPNKPFEAVPSVGFGEDAVKSLGSGLGRGTITTLGALGDARDLLSKGVDLAGSKLGIDLSPLKTAASYSPLGGLAALPTSQQIKSSVTDPVVSPDYEPQYELNKFAKKTAEFGPNMVFGGPGGTARTALTNVIAPAIGSELGGRFGGPVGEVAGALIGAGSASSAARRFNEALAARNAAKAIPAGEDILKSGREGFKAAEDMNLVTTPDFATGAASKLRSDLKGFDPETNPAFGLADRLERLGATPKSNITPAQKLQMEMNWEAVPPPAPASPVKMNDVEILRQELSSLKKSNDGPTREAARRAIQSLQESQLALTPAQVLNGDAAKYVSTMKNAIGDYATAKNWQTLQGKRNLAELNAGSPVGALDSAIGGQSLQRTMKQLARPRNNTDVPVAQALGFKKDEVAAIQKAAMGNKAQHAAELLDRLVPAKLGAIPAAIARQIGGLDTKRQVAALDSLVRSRSPHAQAVAASFPPQVVNRLPSRTQRLLRSLALAEFANQSGQAISQPNAYPAR